MQQFEKFLRTGNFLDVCLAKETILSFQEWKIIQKANTKIIKDRESLVFMFSKLL